MKGKKCDCRKGWMERWSVVARGTSESVLAVVRNIKKFTSKV